MKWRAGLAGLLLSLLGALAYSGEAAAVTARTPPGLSPLIAVTPAIQDRVLGPNERSVSFIVELSNQNSVPITFSVSTNDFTSADQTGGLTFLGTDVTRVTNGNGLSGIMKLDRQVVTVPANGSQRVTARIDDVRQLAPGGHYAAIVAQTLPENSAPSGNRVAINQAVSSLVFLETAGKGTKTLELLKPSYSAVSFSLPKQINLVFKASGNTQTIPRGIVSVTHGSTVVQRAVINENSSLILPGSTRLLQTNVDGRRRPLLPGFYTLRVEYRYEGSLGITTYEQRFLYLNLPFITLLLSLLGMALYGATYSRKRWQPIALKPFRAITIRRDNSHVTTTSIKKSISKK